MALRQRQVYQAPIDSQAGTEDAQVLGQQRDSIEGEGDDRRRISRENGHRVDQAAQQEVRVENRPGQLDPSASPGRAIEMPVPVSGSFPSLTQPDVRAVPTISSFIV